MNAKRNSLVIIYQIPTYNVQPQLINGVPTNVSVARVPNLVNVNAMSNQMGAYQVGVVPTQPVTRIQTSPRVQVGVPNQTVVANQMGVPTQTFVPTQVSVSTSQVGVAKTWGVVNIIDGQVIVPTTNFDDPIYTYEGDLILDYSYYVSNNTIMYPVRSANMIEPVDVNNFRLVYTAANCSLSIDGTNYLSSATTRMPSILAIVYMLAQRGYIDISYSNCVVNYCKVFDLCLMCGASLQAPLATGTSIVDTEHKSFHTIDPTKWDITTVNDIVIPWISKEFYIINNQTGVQRVTPVDKSGVKWCVIETTWGVRYDVLWEALVIYIEKLFTKL